MSILADHLCALHGELVDTFATAFSLPGIGVELKITTSPGMMDTFLWMLGRHAGQGCHGLSLASRGDDTVDSGG